MSVQKTEEFKKIVELLKEYQDLSEMQIVAQIKTDSEEFEFSNGKIKKAGK